MRLNSKAKHFLHCVLFISIIYLLESFALKKNGGNPWTDYGIVCTCILYGLRFLILLPLPQAIFNFVGLVFFNAFPGKVTFRTSPLLAPLICIRVVTRGDYPDLVKKNVDRNIKTCIDVGLENFFIEVVSDKSINLKVNPRLREVVIPESYRTSSGALYKSRALQYCLEDKVNLLSDNDWIIHLDEETIITEECIKGILNFVIDGKYHIGQGLITYANEEVVNWLTTLADSFRVADDMGKLRLQFKVFHKPLFSFKGSYVVTQYGTEKAISFDNGPDGSIAEDCYFAIKAFSMGYSFNFIEGQMWEQSPFTLKDFIQQRKRWLQGILLVVHAKALPFKYKICLGLSCYSWVTLPLVLLNVFLAPMFPLPSIAFLDFTMSFVGAVNVYMFMFGVLKSFNVQRYGLGTFFICLCGSVAVIPFNAIMENIAVLWGYFGRKHTFYIVQKGSVNGVESEQCV